MAVLKSKVYPSKHLGALCVRAEVIEQALYLPDGYRIVDMAYSDSLRVLKLVLSSDELREVEDGELLPQLDLSITVEWYPPDPTYRRYSGTIEMGEIQ